MRTENKKLCLFSKRFAFSASMALATMGSGWASVENVPLIELDNQTSIMQTINIKGRVIDQNGEPIIGANVVVKGTTNGTITDLDGNFDLNVNQGDKIDISFIGYISQELKIVNGKFLTVSLKEDTETLEEVVVVGYGTQKKGSIATAISTVKSKDILNRPVNTVGETLQGQVPGLNIHASAAPGSDPSLQLRGHSSLNGGGSPLILVDGVESSFNFLNPDDIASVSVLKDAASSAIYGSRGANGVILITTKRGEVGKPVFHYSGSAGFNTPTSMQKFISSADWARYTNESVINSGGKPVYTDEEIRKFEDGSEPNKYPNTDWMSLGLRNSFTTRHSIEVSGGTDVVKYLVSGSYDHQTGVFPQTNHNVFNVRSNIDIKLNKRMDITTDVRYQVRDLKELGDMADCYKQLLCMAPTDVAYYTDGTYGYNPGFFPNALVTIYESGQRIKHLHEASGIFKFNYNIIDNLKFTGIANVRYNFANVEMRSRQTHFTDFFTKEVHHIGLNAFSDRRDYSVYYNLQALLNYNKAFGEHHFDLLAGYQQEQGESDWLSGSRSGYPTDLVWELNPGPKDQWNNDGSGSHWALASFIGRINYDYANKYIASFSIRADASSRFTKENRWSSFPSVAAAWRISQEPFMEKTKEVVSDLKLRASWGQTGMANGLGLYPSYTTIGMGAVVLDNTYGQCAGLASIGNPDLGWEHSDMWNIGVDALLFNNRLSFTGEYYIKDTKDILLNLPVPLEYGFGNQKVNIGQMRNKGWEVSIGWRDKIRDFNYSVNFNLSDNTNEVVDLAGTGPWKGNTTYTEEGKPFNQIYGYETMGLFQSEDEIKKAPYQNAKTRPGDIRFKDQNGDNKIDANDRVVLGDPFAHFLYGLKFDFEYKGFDLGLFFQGIGKRDIVMDKNTIAYSYNRPSMLDHWSPTNMDAKYPAPNADPNPFNNMYSDFWKINGGYLRLKNLSFGYTIPKSWANSIGLNSVRAYFSANNLFSISNFIEGLDPESPNSVAYPYAKTFSFGLNVQF